MPCVWSLAIPQFKAAVKAQASSASRTSTAKEATKSRPPHARSIKAIHRNTSDRAGHTPAIKWLQGQRLAFEVRPYAYVERGGAVNSAHVLGLDPYAAVNTLVMQGELGRAVVVLMHGNAEVYTKALAREVSCKTVTTCLPKEANKDSGYVVGGTSPFGLRKDMPVYVETSVLALPMMAINAGKLGLLVLVDPTCLLRLGAVAVQCAKPKTLRWQLMH